MRNRILVSAGFRNQIVLELQLPLDCKTHMHTLFCSRSLALSVMVTRTYTRRRTHTHTHAHKLLVSIYTSLPLKSVEVATGWHEGMESPFFRVHSGFTFLLLFAF